MASSCHSSRTRWGYAFSSWFLYLPEFLESNECNIMWLFQRFDDTCWSVCDNSSGIYPNRFSYASISSLGLEVSFKPFKSSAFFPLTSSAFMLPSYYSCDQVASWSCGIYAADVYACSHEETEFVTFADDLFQAKLTADCILEWETTFSIPHGEDRRRQSAQKCYCERSSPFGCG